MLKIDKKSYKSIGIYNIGYIAINKIDGCENINRVNPLYLNITHASGYIKEKGVKKYLVFDSTDENKKLIKKYNDVFNGITDKIKVINSDEPYLYNGCHDLMQKGMSFNNVAIVYVKGNTYRIHFWYMSKDDAINKMNGSNLIYKSGVL